MESGSKIRESNFELLRLIAMIMVVTVHVDFQSLGWPTSIDLQEHFSSTAIKIFVESFCIVCVDVFVLISGWFGIRPNTKKLASFFFQCIFFSIGLWLVCPLWGVERISGIEESVKSLMCLEYWFVPAYMCLFIVAPVLNSFMEESGNEKKKIRVIAAFFLFQFIYGWVVNSCGFYKGYSTLSFIGLYLLGRYLKLNSRKISGMSAKTYFALYAVTCCIIALFEILLLRCGVQNYALFSYNSPLIIAASVFLIMGVSKTHFQSKIINYIAASTFAIYLFHQHPTIVPIFTQDVVLIFTTAGGVGALGEIILFIVVVCAISILIDQIRIICWKLLMYWIKTARKRAECA